MSDPNGNRPAFPVDLTTQMVGAPESGITVREHAAIQIMAALASNHGAVLAANEAARDADDERATSDVLAQLACRYADALLSALEDK